MKPDIPGIFSSFRNVIAAQSTRLGGVSPHPFDSLNMGFSFGDKEENVFRNRELFYGSLGVNSTNVSWSGQVHGTKIFVARHGGKNSGYDALITNKENIFVAVGIADCCPVLVYDSRNNAVAAIHAGWRGTVSNIVSLTLKKMQSEFGTAGKDCYAYIGTSIGECSFEVGPEVASEFASEFVRWDEAKQKHFVDLKKANKAQLLSEGVSVSNIEVSPYDTVLNNNKYFSYRREGPISGRMLALIGMKTANFTP